MNRSLLLLMLFVSLGGSGVMANDFPTQARVEFVLNCMHEQGDQSYDTLYPCVCAIDRIAAQIAYSDYTQAQTLSFLYRTPGEKGGMFRDAAPRAQERIKSLRGLQAAAAEKCFVSEKVNP